MSGPVLVELIDGQIVTSCAESWRLETEARYVLAKPLHERSAWLDSIEARRGKEAADYLRDAVRRVHASRALQVATNTSDDRKGGA